MSARPGGISGEHSASRTLATVVAAPVAAALVGAAVSAFLPGSESVRTGIGSHLIVPLWVGLACILPLQRSGRRAWLVCAAIALPLAAALALRALL